MSQKIELLPCPFCGGVAHIIYDHDVVEESSEKDWAYTVECCACAASSGLCYSKEQAIEAWNKRDVRDAIMQEPTAEPEIIHCKECGRYIPHDKRCGFWNHGVNIDWSCSQGERR